MFNESLSQVAVMGDREWFYHADCVSLFPQIFKIQLMWKLKKHTIGCFDILGILHHFKNNRNVI